MLINCCDSIVAQCNLLFEEQVERDFGVGNQIVFVDVALQQAHLEKNSQDLLQVLLTNSCEL